MALEVDWREPPPSPEARLKEELKKNPGRWARIKVDMKSPTSAPAWRKEGFEARALAAESDPKKFDIYARWPASSTPGTRAAVGLPKHEPEPEPAPAAEPSPAKAKTPAPKDNSDMHIPTSGDVTGGYLASRANRGVPAEGAHAIRLAGPTASPVRP